jgi:hypothetical protein
MRASRANYASGDLSGGTPEERLAAMDSYSSYCGTYEVKGNKVIHHIELSLFPNWSGVDQERFFEFSSEDRLTLSTRPMAAGGEELTLHANWQRVRMTGEAAPKFQ